MRQIVTFKEIVILCLMIFYFVSIGLFCLIWSYFVSFKSYFPLLYVIYGTFFDGQTFTESIKLVKIVHHPPPSVTPRAITAF